MANAPSTFNVLRSFLCQQNRSPNLNNNNITQKARGKTVRKLHFRFPWALFFKVCAIVQRFSHILVSGKLIGARILLTIGINCVYESLCCFASASVALSYLGIIIIIKKPNNGAHSSLTTRAQQSRPNLATIRKQLNEHYSEVVKCSRSLTLRVYAYVCVWGCVCIGGRWVCAKGAQHDVFVYFARVRQINLNLPALFARRLINSYQHKFVADLKSPLALFCIELYFFAAYSIITLKKLTNSHAQFALV